MFSQNESIKFKNYLMSLQGGSLSDYNGKHQASKLRQILTGARITTTECIAGSSSIKTI